VSAANLRAYRRKFLNVRWLERRDQILRLRGHRCMNCDAYSTDVRELRHDPRREPWEAPDAELGVVCAACWPTVEARLQEMELSIMYKLIDGLDEDAALARARAALAPTRRRDALRRMLRRGVA
jgi:hypothetical protein